MTPHPDSHVAIPQRWHGQSAASLILSTVIAASSNAAEPPPSAPVTAAPNPTVRAYTLQECLAIARCQQPSMNAAASSLSAAQTAEYGLNRLRFGRLLARDLPVRRQQAALGVDAACANLTQVERDVACSVARMYFSIIYAREQRKVAETVVTRLKATVAVGEILLGKDGAPQDLDQISVDRAKLYLKLADVKQDEVHRGIQRATAGLREAMGIGPDAPLEIADGKLPEALPGVKKDTIIRFAVDLRGEVGQASSAYGIMQLEVEAQSKTRRAKFPTAASGGDMHARPIPTGSFGDDYKPAAIGIELPTLFVGPRAVRMERASELADRAASVVEKARNLVALDAEDAFLRWEEAFNKIAKLKKAPGDADELAEKTKTALDNGSVKSYRDVVEIQVLASQLRAQYNEALYQHAVALTELERVTAGGFPAGVTVISAR
jgi:outer membrane protein TolC